MKNIPIEDFINNSPEERQEILRKLNKPTLFELVIKVLLKWSAPEKLSTPSGGFNTKVFNSHRQTYGYKSRYRRRW